MAQRGLLKPLVWRLATVTVLGREHLEGLTRPFVVVSNHTSHLDAPLIYRLRCRASWRATSPPGPPPDYFFDVWWRKSLTALFFNAFPVDRTGLRGRKGLATSLLDDGVPLLLFPEGTRSRTGEMGNFKPGCRGAVHQPGRAMPAGGDRRRGRRDAVRAELAGPAVARRSTSCFGEPMRAEDGETVAQFSDRIAKEVRGLVDYAMTYRAEQQLTAATARFRR